MLVEKRMFKVGSVITALAAAAAAAAILMAIPEPSFAWTNARGPNSCTQLTEGQSKVLNGYVGLPVFAYFTLLRHDDKTLTEDYRGYNQPIPAGSKVASYEAVVNIKFLNQKGVYNSKLAARFEKKLRHCFDRIEDKLRGPDGEFLKLSLAKDRPDAPTPPVKEIKIQKGWFYRANSANWKTLASCSLMVHETMHLLSLVDEYEELWTENEVQENGYTEYRTIFDCRAIGPKNSVMFYQKAAMRASGLDWFSRLIHRDGRQSLLTPTQFRAITEPGCADRNPTYFACAQNAYRTSIGHGGLGCLEDVPAACAHKDWVSQL